MRDRISIPSQRNVSSWDMIMKNSRTCYEIILKERLSKIEMSTSLKIIRHSKSEKIARQIEDSVNLDIIPPPTEQDNRRHGIEDVVDAVSNTSISDDIIDDKLMLKRKKASAL